MESLIVNNQKRKKRKSRKRLNAIRKKALQNVSVKDFHKGCDVKTNNFCTHKASICITSKRLTLFNKAVTSDTVSRANISEVKSKGCDKDYKKDYVNVVAKLMSPLNRQVTKVLKTDYDNQKTNHVSCDSKKCNYGEFSVKTQSSVVLFCSSQQAGDSDVSDAFQIDHMLPDTPLRNDSFSEYKCYNDLIKEIPLYLKKTAPMLLNEDFVHKCKTSLRNIYMENDQLCVKDSTALWTSSSHTSQESFIQNPTDYTVYNPYNNPEVITSPLVSLASNSTCSSPLSMAVSDSPEYVYYPHRLNH